MAFSRGEKCHDGHCKCQNLKSTTAYRLTRELGEARTTIAQLRAEGASTIPTAAVEEAEQRKRAAEARADALQREVDSLRQRLESSRLPALNAGGGMEGRKEYERPGNAGEGSQQDKARPSSAGGVPRQPAGGLGTKRPESPSSSSSKSAEEKLKGLIKENSQCHAQIRMLSAEVVGLSEALEMVTRRASEQRDAAEQHERAHLHHQQDKSSKGSASGVKKKKSSASSFKRRSAAAEYPDVMSTRIYTAATGGSSGGRRAADETSPSRPGQVGRLQGDLFPGFYEGGGASSGAGAKAYAWG
jgi:DNA repair exonuclease SbcCD ATPase subunit